MFVEADSDVPSELRVWDTICLAQHDLYLVGFETAT
jgi:hypothetical protein